MRSTLLCLVIVACGPSKPTATERTAPVTPEKPATLEKPAAPPPGPWLTVTASGAVRVVHPGRWSCDGGGRTFRVGARTDCILPIEFVASYQVFGCPDVVTHGDETERATYDGRGRLLTYGPRPDYQTEYTYGDADVPLTRNGREVTVSRQGATVTWDEDHVVTKFTLDAQDRLVAVDGPAKQKLAWSGDDLAIVDWHMAGLDDVRDVYQTCSGAKPTPPVMEPTGGTIRLVNYKGLDTSSLSVARVVDVLDVAPYADVRGCYRTVLDRDPTAAGKLVLAFTIGKAGRLVQATAQTFDPAFDRCLDAAMKKWTFPVPIADGKPTEVRFVFELEISPG